MSVRIWLIMLQFSSIWMRHPTANSTWRINIRTQYYQSRWRWPERETHRKNIWWNFVGPIFSLFASKHPSEAEANICFLFRRIMFIQWCTQCTSTQPIIIVIFINKIVARIHGLVSNAVQNTKFTQNDKLWTKWIDAHSTRRNISNLIIHLIVVHSNIKQTHVVFSAIHPNTHTHTLSNGSYNASKCTRNGHGYASQHFHAEFGRQRKNSPGRQRNGIKFRSVLTPSRDLYRIRLGMALFSAVIV